jgi:4-hydroxy-4-methyl-2-oxoglutarate aldolase
MYFDPKESFTVATSQLNHSANNSQRAVGRVAQDRDFELFNRMETTLYTAVIADALDQLGYHDRAMREYLRPLSPDAKFAGWARTILCQDIFYEPSNLYELEIEAVDSIVTGEVVVVSTGASIRNAPWGELLSTAARARGARGAVIDGLVRDVKTIQKLEFPVFAAGIKPVDSRGRGMVIDYNVPVQCGGIIITPGDLIFADYDGVVAIPSNVLQETLAIATDKASKENHSRDALLNGAYLADVYAKFGVL